MKKCFTKLKNAFQADHLKNFLKSETKNSEKNLSENVIKWLINCTSFEKKSSFPSNLSNLQLFSPTKTKEQHKSFFQDLNCIHKFPLNRSNFSYLSEFLFSREKS